MRLQGKVIEAGVQESERTGDEYGLLLVLSGREAVDVVCEPGVARRIHVGEPLDEVVEVRAEVYRGTPRLRCRVVPRSVPAGVAG